MPEIGNSSVWKQTDANNTTGTQPSWSGSASPDTIDNAGRAMMGAITREWNWRNYTVTSTNSGNAYTITYSVTPAARYDGQRFSFIVNAANTGAVTLTEGNGAKSVKKLVAGIKTALASGDWAAGDFVEVAWNASDDSYIWVNKGAAVSASESTAGLVELATDAETQTGTDTARAITPANLTAKEASASNYRANTADRILTTDIAWSAADTVALTWTSGGNTAVDLSTGINFTVTTATGNSTLAAPTNAKTGQSGSIYITQDGSTPRTLAYASAWVFAGGVDPALTATAGAKDILFYQVLSSTGPVVFGNLIKGVA